MGTNVCKIIDLQSRYAEYGKDGYFIEPHIIGMMIFNELKIAKLEEFVNEASITITEDEIKAFLDKKMYEEEPTLREEIEQSSKPIPNNPAEWTDEDIKRAGRRLGTSILRARYQFEPYSLQYFKIYTSRLREKLQSLFSILNDINRCKSEELSEESKQRLKALDFHINSKGNLFFKDAERLADAIIYNVKDLSEKIQVGNNPETYLTFKESKHRLMKDGVRECELYPSKEIQIRDRYHSHKPEFIALSEEQQTQIQKEELENISRWMKRVFKEDDYEDEKGPVLKKVKEDNK